MRLFLCLIAGAAFGLCLVAEVPSAFALLALSAGLHWISAPHFWVSGFRGAQFGGAAFAVAGCWGPEALRLLGVPTTSVWLFWGVAILFCAALPYMVLGAAVSMLRRTPLWLAAPMIAAVTFGIETVFSRPEMGLPIFLAAYPMSSDGGLLQVAAIAGASGLSSYSLGIAYVFSRIRGEQEPFRVASAALASWLAVSAIGLSAAEWLRTGQDSDSSPFVDLLLIQPKIPRDERWVEGMQVVNLGQLIDFSRKALAALPSPPDAVVWPENVLTTPLEEDSELRRALLQFVDGAQVPLVAGLVARAERDPNDAYRSTVTWVVPTSGPTSSVNKAVAIPIIESSESSPLSRWLQPRMGDLALGPRVVEEPALGALEGPLDVSPLLCYEVLFPRIAALRRSRDSIALLNLTDDGWAPNEAALRLMLRLARFRAIEQRLPLVRLSQGGLSGAFDELGRLTNSVPIGQYASFSIRTSTHQPPTALERSGLLALMIGPAGLVWFSFPAFLRLRALGWRSSSLG